MQLSVIEQVQTIFLIFNKLSHYFVMFRGREKSSLIFTSYMIVKEFWLTLSDIQENDDGSAV